MTGAYFGAFQAGQVNAIARTIDFYGGVGAFAGWPRRIRDCTGPRPTHLPTTASLSKIAMPILVVRGENSHPAVQRANELLCQSIPGATIATVPGAAHFMITTHARELADLIASRFSHAPR
jgi:pimeloyl-ACP methyl ester carboxylesterase